MWLILSMTCLQRLFRGGCGSDVLYANMLNCLMINRIACSEAIRRGWWSYTDMLSYWDSSNTTDLMKNTTTQTTKACLHILLLRARTIHAAHNNDVIDVIFYPNLNCSCGNLV